MLEENNAQHLENFLHLYEQNGTEHVQAFILSSRIGNALYRLLNELSVE